MINNNKKILETLKSRCLNFNIFLSNNQSHEVSKKLINSRKYDLLHQDLFNYYITPGKIFNFINFSEENNIDLTNMKLNELLTYIIDKSLYKTEPYIKNYIYELIEVFMLKNVSNKSFSHFNYFINKINNLKKFNLNEESLFLEFKEKVLNG